MQWREAVKAARGGVTIDVEVVPGASHNQFPSGFNAWRGRIEARVAAPPEDGAANAELCRLAAETLGVAPAAVRVASGAKSRRKSLAVAGLGIEAACALLEARL